MSSFIVKVWCRDCEGDPKGCFDGGFEILDNEDGTPKKFATREQADEAGYDAEGAAPYEHEVIEVPE